MASRVVAIMIALALVAGAAALFLLRGEGESSSNVSALGQPLFPQLKAADVARITVADAQGALNLEKKGGVWSIVERGGFPADIERVGALVVGLLELKSGQSEPIAEKERARMQLSAPGKGEGAATTVTLKAQDGKILAELLVGKKYFKTQPEGDASKMQGDGRFVMLPADPARVILVSDPLKQAVSAAAEWISREGFAIENIKSLEVKLPDDGYAVARDNIDAAWVLDGKGGVLDQNRANSATYALARLEAADLAAAGADAGLDQGPQVTATTFDGVVYRIKFGKPEKDRIFAQVTTEGTPVRSAREAPAPANEKPEDKEKREKAAADEIKRFGERIAREKALASFTVLVPKAKLDDELKKRDDMLKKEPKEEKK